MEFTEIATGLQFPEGPIAMPDGSIVLVEIRRGTLSRVLPGGAIEVIADLGGGPNGAAIGPDGKCYVCNNGGFQWLEVEGSVMPHGQADDYTSGRIERVNLETGEFEVIYTQCDGKPLSGPNDIVFDASGGFYFSDHGKDHDGKHTIGSVYYALPDGSSIQEVVHPIGTPNGVGLSPDEKQLYVSDTTTCRLFAYDILSAGVLAPQRGFFHGECIAGLPDLQMFDSLAVEANGHICVATLITGAIARISPDGAQRVLYETGDPGTTNICFGGPDMQTAYITLSGSGRLVRGRWPGAGLALN